ncbi:MAG: ATP-binding protein [Bacteriovoracaceae bacterium]
MKRLLSILLILASKITFAYNIECRENYCKKTELNDNSSSYHQNNNKQEINLSFKTNVIGCEKDNCWIFLGEVSDSIEVRINEEIILTTKDFNSNFSFARPNSLLFPLSSEILSKEEVNLKFLIYDLNQTLLGINPDRIYIGNYLTASTISNLDWFKRTGATIISSIIQLSFLLLYSIAYLMSKKGQIRSLLLYNLISSIYLFSLSEYPRQFLNPILASGPMHFSLRLFYDMSLLFLIQSFYRVIKKSIELYLIYLFFIFILAFSWILGFHNFKHYQSIMFVAATFILIPPTAGIYYSLKLKIKKKKAVLVFFFLILFTLTINDLLYFWQILPTFFSVKYITPFITLIFSTLILLDIKEDELKNEELKERIKQSERIAHDIRSPLAALEQIVNSTKILDPADKKLARHAFRRINDIAYNLLNNRKKIDDSSPQLVTPIIESIISEKRVQFQHMPGISIESKNSDPSTFSFINANPIEIKRVLSNIINNSVESLKSMEGTVKVHWSQEINRIIIHISDNGIGIPEQIKNELLTKAISFNKAGGYGIGLTSAKETLERFGGKILIESSENKGTTVTIILETCEKPDWFTDKIILFKNTVAIIGDDDKSIYDLWKKHFDLKNVSVVNFNQQAIDSKESIFFLDYEFQGGRHKAFEVIENLKHSKSYLVTSQFDELEIQRKASALGIYLIPKFQIPYLQIEFKELNPMIVLIDNDELVRITWENKAKMQKQNLVTYKNFYELKSNLNLHKLDTIFYIDSELGDEKKGEEIARELYELGYRELYLCTGHSPEDFKDMSWLKGVRGKTYPT